MRDREVAVGELLAWPDVPPMFTFDDPDGNRFYVVADCPDTASALRLVLRPIYRQRTEDLVR